MEAACRRSLRFARCYAAIAIMAASVLVPVLGSGLASADDTPGAELAPSDITVRDRLIAAQKSLLNVYRYRFSIDTHIVTGGCPNQPSRPPPSTSNPVSAGTRHTCWIQADSTVICWGDNVEGQSDALDGQFTSLAAGHDHTCGLKVNGSVVCWGDIHSWYRHTPGGRFTALASGGGHSCGVKIDGSVVC